MLVGALGAALLVATPGGERSEAAEVDVAAVDRYITRLSETVPRPPEATIAKDPPADPKLAKSAGRIDRAEPVVGAVFAVAR